MKKIFTSITLVIASLSLFSQNQIINGDFEAWALIDPDYTFYGPNSWGNGATCVSISNQNNVLLNKIVQLTLILGIMQ